MKKAPAKWVPHLLTDAEKQHRVQMSRDSLQMLCHRIDPIDTVIAQDESWFHCWDLEPKFATREWIVPRDLWPEKVRIERTVQKVMLVAFLDKDGVMHKEFVPDGRGIRAELYLQILQRFLVSLRRRRPQLAMGSDTTTFLNSRTPSRQPSMQFQWPNSLQQWIDSLSTSDSASHRRDIILRDIDNVHFFTQDSHFLTVLDYFPRSLTWILNWF